MFQALLCPSSGARDYYDVYHIGRVVLGLMHVGDEVQLGWRSLQPGDYASLTPTILQRTANQERHDQCGK